MIRRVVAGGYERWEALITMTTTDTILGERAREIAGGYVIGPTRPTAANARPAYIWTLKGKAVGPAIESMEPYIRLKREQAALLLRLRGMTKAGARRGQKGVQPMTDDERHLRETMRLACRALNGRGTAALPSDQVEALRWARDLGLTHWPAPHPNHRAATAA